MGPSWRFILSIEETSAHLESGRFSAESLSLVDTPTSEESSPATDLPQPLDMSLDHTKPSSLRLKSLLCGRLSLWLTAMKDLYDGRLFEYRLSGPGLQVQVEAPENFGTSKILQASIELQYFQYQIGDLGDLLKVIPKLHLDKEGKHKATNTTNLDTGTNRHMWSFERIAYSII